MGYYARPHDRACTQEDVPSLLFLECILRTNPVRATSFIGGVLLSAYMYLLVSVTALGSSPLFVLEEGIVAVTGLPFGVVTAATGLFLLALAAILRAPVGPGTLAVPILFGLGVELMAPFVPTIDGTTPGGFVLRFAVLVVATHLMTLGGALVVMAAYGAAAIDAVMIGLSSVLRRDTARVRIVMEVTMAAGGAALGGTTGLGTVVAGLMMGHSFRYWATLLDVADKETPHRAPCARSRRTSRRYAQPPGAVVEAPGDVEGTPVDVVVEVPVDPLRSSRVGSSGSASRTGSGTPSANSSVISVRRTTKFPDVPINSMLSIATNSPSSKRST